MGVLVAVGVSVMVTYGVSKAPGAFSVGTIVGAALEQAERVSTAASEMIMHFIGFIPRIILCKMNLPASSGYATLSA